MHIIFDPSTNYGSFIQQDGEGSFYKGLPPFQRGYGRFVGMPPYQRGDGLGSIFKSFWRVLRPLAQSLAPVLKSAGNVIGQEGLATSARVLTDVVQGTDLKEALETGGREGAVNLLKRAQRKISGGQTGNGSRKRQYKKNAPFKNKIILKPDDFVGRIVRGRKKAKFDNLGSY